MANNPAVGQYIAYFILGMGALFGGAACYVLAAALRLRVTAHRAEGTVVRLERITRPSPEAETITTYHPVVTFPTNGGLAQFQAQFGTGPSNFAVGDKVTVLYYPDRPKDAQIEGFAQQFLLPIVLAGIGAACALVGWLILMTAKA
jgi:hypothetical protein